MIGAAIGSAVIGGATAYSGAKKQAGAARDAAASSLQATRETNAQNWEMYEQTRSDQAPWMAAGSAALQRIEEMPDFNFEEFNFNADDLYKDPSYQFRQQEGINALDASAASRGRILSGAQDKAVTQYGQDLAATEYSNAYNRASAEHGNAYNRAMAEYTTKLSKDQSLANVGQSATNLVSQAGINTASTTGQNTIAGQQSVNAYNQIGAQATAQGYAGVANSINKGIANYLLKPNNAGPVGGHTTASGQWVGP